MSGIRVTVLAVRDGLLAHLADPALDDVRAEDIVVNILGYGPAYQRIDIVRAPLVRADRLLFGSATPTSQRFRSG